MKRTLVFLLLTAAFLAGCGSAADPAAVPTATPTPEMGHVLIEEFRSTATVEAGQSPQPDSDDCDNPFYPVRDGATWTYSLSSRGSAVHTLSVDDNGSFIISVQAAESSASIMGQCSPEGIILMDSPGSLTSVSGESGSAGLITVNESGVTLPKDIGIGQSWPQTISADTSMGKTTIESNYSAVGFENITVPAGEFYVLKVEQTATVKFMGQSIAMHGFHWYAEGVGVVKSAMDGAPSVELADYNIPD